MSGAIRVLKADLKANLANLEGAVFGLIIGVGFLAVFWQRL